LQALLAGSDVGSFIVAVRISKHDDPSETRIQRVLCPSTARRTQLLAAELSLREGMEAFKWSPTHSLIEKPVLSQRETEISPRGLRRVS
jgi:hypothetical protein